MILDNGLHGLACGEYGARPEGVERGVGLDDLEDLPSALRVLRVAVFELQHLPHLTHRALLQQLRRTAVLNTRLDERVHMVRTVNSVDVVLQALVKIYYFSRSLWRHC